MKVKTSEATTRQLDWLVAKCEGAIHVLKGEHVGLLHWPSPKFGAEPKWSVQAPEYSTNWAQGGQIIEREQICICVCTWNSPWIGKWNATCNLDGSVDEYGPTPLIAAMRCFVASKLGDEVEVSNELE